MGERKRTEDMMGPARTGVWVILDAMSSRPVHEDTTAREQLSRAWVGKIIAAYPADGAGRLRVTAWDNTPESEGTRRYGCHDGMAGGYGYDKASAAISDALLVGGGFGRACEAEDIQALQKAHGAGESAVFAVLERRGYVVIRAL